MQSVFGWIWLCFGALGFALVVFSSQGFIASAATDKSGIMVSLFALLFSCLACVFGWGMKRGRRWSKVLGLLLSVVLAFYCTLFIALVALEFGKAAFILALAGLMFSVVTMSVLLRKL